MPLRVVRDPGPTSPWRAIDGEDEVGRALAWTRPDGRTSIAGLPPSPEVAAALVAAVAGEQAGELLVNVGPSDGRIAALAGLGFAEKRREARFEIPVAGAARALDPADLGPGPGIVTAAAHEVDEAGLRRLDDLLRHDVPGTDGWHWSPEDFRAETFGERYDAELYRVAVEAGSGGYVGLARVWAPPPAGGPYRAGLVGVVRSHRRRGLGIALLGEALRVLDRRGVTTVSTEADVANQASNALLARLGAVPVGEYVELSRPSVRHCPG